MSNTACSWAWKQKCGDTIAKSILVKMADIADDNFECFPSFRHIAEQCECDRRTVMRKLDAMQSKGLIARFEARRQNGSETSNRYKLKPTKAELEASNLETEARRKIKRDALLAKLAEKEAGSDTETLPSDSLTLPEVVTERHSASDSDDTPPSDSDDTPPSDSDDTPIHQRSTPQIEPTAYTCAPEYEKLSDWEAKGGTSEAYLAFIDAYPKNPTKKSNAKFQWFRDRGGWNCEHIAHEVMAALAGQLANCHGYSDPRYTPKPELYLEDEKWRDKIVTAETDEEREQEKIKEKVRQERLARQAALREQEASQ